MGDIKKLEDLAGLERKEIFEIFDAGVLPEWNLLKGYEFRGLNTYFDVLKGQQGVWQKAGRVLGFQKFQKGFLEWSGTPMGYNVMTAQGPISEPWHSKPNEEHPKRFGYYTVEPSKDVDNVHPNALLLDYSKGYDVLHGYKPTPFPLNRIRDYVVQVDKENPDLFLGIMYFDMGKSRPIFNVFGLERRRQSGL